MGIFSFQDELSRVRVLTVGLGSPLKSTKRPICGVKAGNQGQSGTVIHTDATCWTT